MIKSLRKKFIMINMLLVFLILAVVFISLTISNYRGIRSESDKSLEMALKRRDNQQNPKFQLGDKPPKDMTAYPIFVIQVTNSNTPVLISSDNITVSDDELSKITALVLESGSRKGTLNSYNLRYLIEYEFEGYRIAFIEVSNEKEALRDLILSSLLTLAKSMLGFFIVSIYLSKWVLRPVERAWNQQRQFVADASHELKTPLTIILANTGILKAHPEASISEHINWINNTETEAIRMKKLIDDMLFLAKADNAKTSFVFGSINLSDIAFNTLLTFESVAYEKKISLDMEIEDNILIQGDESMLKQLIGILLDNAIKYSEIMGRIKLYLYLKNNKAYLLVNNTGNPLNKESLMHLFERFYQADKSRSPEGYGLGLSIAESIVKNHNGDITVDSCEGEGTTFTVIFEHAEKE